MTNVRTGYTYVYSEFGLKVRSQRCPYRSDRTYVKDMKDPAKAQPPGSDRLFITRAEKSGDHIPKSRGHIPFIPLDSFPPDLGHSPVIESMVSKLPGICIACSAHVVSCSIASRTDRLS